MAEVTPVADRPWMPKQYGIAGAGKGLLEWCRVEERLAAAVAVGWSGICRRSAPSVATTAGPGPWPSFGGYEPVATGPVGVDSWSGGSRR